jgi:hypothetical protein
MKTTALIALSLLTLSARAAWTIAEVPGKHVDVLRDGKLQARYMTAHDTTSKESLLETYKPYLHVYNPAGTRTITKGPGGEFTHHRGIFIGWNRIKANGKDYDRWHMKGGEQVHTGLSAQEAGEKGASLTSKVDWNDEAGKPFLTELRTMSFSPGPGPAYLVIDFTSTLKPVVGDVVLGGDPEHAGCHFRPDTDIVKDKTEYLYPVANADAHKDRDYPWVAEHFTLKDGSFSVAHLNHPDNPKGTAYSAYRNYGRFGAFATATIKAGESLILKYRFVVKEGDLPEVPVICETWNSFAGKTQPAPAEVTRKPAEGAKK